MGEMKPPNFHDFGMFGCVHEPPNQLYRSSGTPGYLKDPKTIQHSFRKRLFGKYQDLGNQRFEKCGKDGHQQIMKLHLGNSLNLKYGINIFQKT